MIRSFLNVYTRDIGIQTDRLMAMQLQLPQIRSATADARRAFYERLTPRLTSIGGVEAIPSRRASRPWDAAHARSRSKAGPRAHRTTSRRPRPA